MSDELEPIVVNVYSDEPTTGLWCHQCQLPSVTRTILHLGHPESETVWVAHQCEDVPEHVLIESEPADMRRRKPRLTATGRERLIQVIDGGGASYFRTLYGMAPSERLLAAADEALIDAVNRQEQQT